ncbi:MAG TPA: M48 family metalloprotease, partial [Pyrinomonadaceae bacterium]|nr:M48 family metalloprotease [Pyrinomonadaceae bacterium]
MFSLQLQARQISTWRRRLIAACPVLIISAMLSPAVLAQAKCQPPAAPPNPANLFNEEQEMALGDVVAEQMESGSRIIDDDSVVGNLRRIGERLIAGAPPTHLRFQFFVVDSYEVNAFTLPGGRIYVTRKLIAFAKNEDELAGVIAHELGHVLARHLANDMSTLWREGLGVSQVGDHRDIYEKYQTLMDTIMLKPKLGDRGKREERDQYTADMIGLYLLTGAGYDPQAQAGFWDRYQDTKGKTGGFFSKL